MNFVLIFVGILLLVTQIGLLGVLVQLGGKRAEHHVYRFYNPLAWFTLFYILWFLLPQFLVLVPNHFLIGFEAESPSFRLRTSLVTQFYLITFLVAVLAGASITSSTWPTCVGERPLRMRRKLKGTDQIYIFICFVFGTLSTLYLGSQLMAMEGYRSQLVQSNSGRVLTAIAFFGNFAFAVVFARGIVEKRYMVAAVSLVIFGGAVFLTGARGRVMFPLLLAMIYLFSYRNAFDFRFVAAIAGIMISILLFSDVLFLALRDGRETRSVAFQELFTKRNFDGFANFAMISGYDELPLSPSVLVTGARKVVMEHYFPRMWAKGVGTGVTVPGMFWVAASWPGVVLLGTGYGAVLGGINVALRKITDERLFWAYLFSMVWFCAIGGNLQESMDKMVIAAMPGVLWWGIDMQIKSRAPVVSKRQETSKPVSERPRHPRYAAARQTSHPDS